VSPIYVRPAREQSEHDRLIRHLQTKYKRKFEAAVNIDGVEPPVPVKIGAASFFPDLVLTAGKKLAGVVEVETGESVNNLEVMAQWVHFSQARVPFHLYVPVHGYEAARRLSDAYHVKATEIWTYRPVSDGFDLVRMHADPAAVAAAARSAARAERAAASKVPAPAPPPRPKAKPSPKTAAKPAKPKPVAKARPAKSVKSAKSAKPTKSAKSAKPAKPARSASRAARARGRSTNAKKPAAKAKKPAGRKSR
jgi:hypothetical protein